MTSTISATGGRGIGGLVRSQYSPLPKERRASMELVLTHSTFDSSLARRSHISVLIFPCPTAKTVLG